MPQQQPNDTPQSRPLVSVIVPTYKRLPYLAQTVRSILEQQYSALEVFVIADGHDQDVADFVSGLTDTRVSYLASPHAGRPSVPRNFGIARAQGDYIAFCADDDLWETEKLRKQMDLMMQAESGFCFTGSVDIDQNGARLSEFDPANFNDRISKTDFLLSLGGMIPNSSIVVSREVLEKSGPLNESTDLRAMEDYEICSRFLIHTDAVGIVEPLVGYRNHQGSIQPQSITDWLQSQGRLQSAIMANGSAPPWVWSLRYLRVFYWALRLSLGRSRSEFARWQEPSN